MRCRKSLVAPSLSRRETPADGDGNVQAVPLLGGSRVIVHTLLAFERAASISSIVVVCRPEDQAAVQCLADQHAIGSCAPL